MSRRKKQRHRGAQTASFATPVQLPAMTDTSRRNLPADMRGMVATANNDITIPFFSGSLQYVDDTLIQRGGGQGLKIYDEIERDGHAFSMLQKRKKVLVARAWEVEPASDEARDVAAADLCREVLTSLNFDLLTEELLDATLKGFAISEIAWTRDGNRIVPARIKSHDQRRFSFGHDWQPRLRTWTNMLDGEELPPRKFIVHRHGVKGNNPYGLGLGTRLFWPVLFKREGITFWLHFLDKFAGPTVVGKVPYGTLTAEQDRLLNGLMNIRTSSAITVPMGAEVEFLEAARSGSVTYQDFLAYWDRQISITTTGETLTSQVGDSGSRALGDVHQEMLELLVDSDADLLSGSLRSQLLTWLVEYNVPGAQVPYIWRVRPKNEAAAADVRKKKGDAATATNSALISVLKSAAKIEDDDAAREFIVSFDLMDGLSDATVDQLVAARFDFADADNVGSVPPAEPNPAFAMGNRLKKKRLGTSASLSRAVSLIA